MADELEMKFMETSTKFNEGVEEAFFTLTRHVGAAFACSDHSNFQNANRDIKTRLIESEPDAGQAAPLSSSTINVNFEQAGGSELPVSGLLFTLESSFTRRCGYSEWAGCST